MKDAAAIGSFVLMGTAACQTDQTKSVGVVDQCEDMPTAPLKAASRTSLSVGCVCVYKTGSKSRLPRITSVDR